MRPRISASIPTRYVVYEFWTRQLIGTFKGSFVTRPLAPYDCDIYSIVEKQDRQCWFYEPAYPADGV